MLFFVHHFNLGNMGGPWKIKDRKDNVPCECEFELRERGREEERRRSLVSLTPNPAETITLSFVLFAARRCSSGAQKLRVEVKTLTAIDAPTQTASE
jgi:hypothetical protein